MHPPDQDDETGEHRLVPFPDSAERRLRRALRNLDAALSEQRDAVAEFRSQIGALDGAVARLGSQVRALSGTLTDLADDTTRAEAGPLGLMATADRMEALTRR